MVAAYGANSFYVHRTTCSISNKNAIIEGITSGKDLTSKNSFIL